MISSNYPEFTGSALNAAHFSVRNAEQRVHLVSSLFPSIDWSCVELGKPIPASLYAELEAQGGDVMVSFPPNEVAVLRKYRKW